MSADEGGILLQMLLKLRNKRTRVKATPSSERAGCSNKSSPGRLVDMR